MDQSGWASLSRRCVICRPLAPFHPPDWAVRIGRLPHGKKYYVLRPKNGTPTGPPSLHSAECRRRDRRISPPTPTQPQDVASDAAAMDACGASSALRLPGLYSVPRRTGGDAYPAPPSLILIYPPRKLPRPTQLLPARGNRPPSSPTARPTRQNLIGICWPATEQLLTTEPRRRECVRAARRADV